MHDLVAQGYAEQTDGAGGDGGEVREQAEKVLRVQLAAFEGARDVNAAQDVFGEEGGVDGLGLHNVGGVDEVLEKFLVEIPELVEAEGGCLAGGRGVRRCGSEVWGVCC